MRKTYKRKNYGRLISKQVIELGVKNPYKFNDFLIPWKSLNEYFKIFPLFKQMRINGEKFRKSLVNKYLSFEKISS